MVDTPRSGATADAEPDVGDQVGLGPAPKVQGRDRIRAGARAALFGAGDPSTQDTLLGEDRELAEEPDPDKIGRFKVLKRLGSGGMGVVFSAYDPELDRKVAIKLLRPDLVAGSSGSSGTSRLQREAQAMARLNHPNVATVHEVGTHRDQVFVAMEFVDGGTLRQWLEAERSAAEILAAYLDAGAGLAAAHAAGIVHRDFKPDNVMIDADGRARVMDFGLSRARGQGNEEATIAVRGALEPDVDPMATPLTETGAIMGTPAYMAPEQHQGRAADERSDQFSFCVALYEALCGVRPFAGKAYPELVANVLGGKIRPLPTGAKASRRVLAALEQGLAVNAEDRHPSMDALLRALAADPARWWRRGGLAVVLMGAASAATLLAVGDGAVAKDACEEERARVEEVWGGPRSEAVHEALLATQVPYAEPVWRSTERMLDRYAADWASAAAELCAARLVAADPDEVTYQRRRRCLDARRAELGQLVELLTRDDKTLALQAVQAAATLSEIAGCADAKQLQAWSVRRDGASEAALAHARERLGRAKAAGALGRYREATEVASEVVDAGRELDDPALVAAGLLVRGQFLERAGDVAAAEAALRDSVRQAEIVGDHVTRALALIRLVYVVGAEAARVNEARALAADAAAVLRVIGADTLLAAKLDMNLGAVAKAAEEYTVALTHYRKALDAYLEFFGPDHPETARAFANMGSPLSRLQREDEAEEYLLRAYAGFEKTLGPDHPHLGVVLNNLGNNKARARRFEEAVPYLRRALALRERVLGPTHNRVTSTRYNLGTALFIMEDYAAAKPLLRAAADAMQEHSPDDPRMPFYRSHLGIAELLTGDVAAGRETLRAAIVGFRDRGDRKSVQVRSAHFHLAASLLAEQPRDARRLAETGLEIATDLERAAGDADASLDLGKFRGLLWLLDANELMAAGPAGRKR